MHAVTVIQGNGLQVRACDPCFAAIKKGRR